MEALGNQRLVGPLGHHHKVQVDEADGIDFHGIWDILCVPMCSHSRDGQSQTLWTRTMSLSQDLTSKKKILVVDDTPDYLSLMSSLLKDHYNIRLANNGDKALKIIRSDNPPDLVLLDIMMPGLSGYEVCQQLKADPGTRDIPVIFLTALNGGEEESMGLALGGADYITKPFNPNVVLARVQTQLQNKAAKDILRDQNAYLELEVLKRTQEIIAIQDVTVMAMASLAETRDTETGNHILRTQWYVRALALQLSDHPRFAPTLTPAYIDTLFRSAPLHDIGKVGIPDRILLKPGRLEPHEFEIMKTHTTLGRDAIQKAEQTLKLQVAFLQMAKDIAYSHQEKWDGSGYPEGLSGDNIPVSARLMALADVYDALISRRVYKEGMSHEKAMAIITESKGSHFDPDVVNAFLAIHEEFRAIAQRYTDTDHDMERKIDYLTNALAEKP